MEVVIFVLCVFTAVYFALMFLKHYHGRDEKGFPYSRDRKRIKE